MSPVHAVNSYVVTEFERPVNRTRKRGGRRDGKMLTERSGWKEEEEER